MSERIEAVPFTKEMKDTYTILFPDMVHIHFLLLEKALNQAGYHAERLTQEGKKPAETGQKYIHNDTCYPALLTIGQMISTLQSGAYDPDRTALILPQTGGGCRASNYIYLLRKALKAAGYEQVPVISLNLQGMEKQGGFQLTLPLLQKMLVSMAYGDLLMCLANQSRPYETEKGSTDRLVSQWVERLGTDFESSWTLNPMMMKKRMAEIARDFHDLPVDRELKVKVGIVGEIYVKYSALANNHLEDFLAAQGCEVMVPGIMQFLMYAADMPMEDVRLYGGSVFKQSMYQVMSTFLSKYEKLVIQAIGIYPEFTVPSSYYELKELAKGVIGTGCKMGEGWLLTAEMIELISKGYENVICAQPFGCLPNHIVGKAMSAKIRRMMPNANITAIDYDPGSARVNQENRIQLMLSIARENLEKSNQISENRS